MKVQQSQLINASVGVINQPCVEIMFDVIETQASRSEPKLADTALDISRLEVTFYSKFPLNGYFAALGIMGINDKKVVNDKGLYKQDVVTDNVAVLVRHGVKPEILDNFYPEIAAERKAALQAQTSHTERLGK